MENRKKTVILTAVMMLLMLVLTACGGTDDKSGSGTRVTIEGKWKLVSMSGTENDALVNSSLDMYMTIKNGKMTVTGSVMGENQAKERSYTIDGNVMFIEGRRCEFNLSGNRLTITEDGISMVFEKQ